jgi:hypothetical protein
VFVIVLENGEIHHRFYSSSSSLQISFLPPITHTKAISGAVIVPKKAVNSQQQQSITMAPPNADLFNSTTAASTDSPSTPSTPLFKVNSPNVQYTDEHILSKYTYYNTLVTKQSDGSLVAEPTETSYEFKTERSVPRVG